MHHRSPLIISNKINSIIEGIFIAIKKAPDAPLHAKLKTFVSSQIKRPSALNCDYTVEVLIICGGALREELDSTFQNI